MMMLLKKENKIIKQNYWYILHPYRGQIIVRALLYLWSPKRSNSSWIYLTLWTLCKVWNPKKLNQVIDHSGDLHKQIAPLSCYSNFGSAFHSMHLFPCIEFNALNSMHFILSVSFYASHSIHFITCISFYALHSMHFIQCISFYALHSMHYIPCISFFAFHYIHFIPCIYSMHLILCY
jgi:hypothetical protein